MEKCKIPAHNRVPPKRGDAKDGIAFIPESERAIQENKASVAQCQPFHLRVPFWCIGFKR